jgi:hypothetical protein
MIPPEVASRPRETQAGIDLRKETPYSFNYARRFFPRRRKGKRPALATLHRYATQGYRGVVLEMVQVGGTRCTTEAIARFIERVTAISAPHALSSGRALCPRAEGPTSTREVDQALAAAGFDRPARTGRAGRLAGDASPNEGGRSVDTACPAGRSRAPRGRSRWSPERRCARSRASRPRPTRTLGAGQSGSVRRS